MSLKDRIRRRVQSALQGARPSGTGWWRVNCPECLARTGKPDVKQAMSVNVRSGVFWCWKCQLSGKLRGNQYTAPETDRGNAEPMELPEGFVTLWDDQSFSLQPARDYAATRCAPR